MGGINLWNLRMAVNLGCAAHWYAGGDLPYLHADQHGIRFLPDALLIGNDGGRLSPIDPDQTCRRTTVQGLATAQTYRMDMDPCSPWTGSSREPRTMAPS